LSFKIVFSGIKPTPFLSCSYDDHLAAGGGASPLRSDKPIISFNAARNRREAAHSLSIFLLFATSRIINKDGILPQKALNINYIQSYFHIITPAIKYLNLVMRFKKAGMKPSFG